LLAVALVLGFTGAEQHADRGEARQERVTSLAVTRVPSPGSWAPGAQIERVVHAFDLPGTDNVLLLCAGSGNSAQWAAQRKFVCYRYDRNTSQYSTFNTPTDWFCNAAVHLDNGNLLIVGGTAIDGYQNANGGKWIGTSETYTYAPASGQVTRIGNVTPEWYPGLLEDQLGGVYKHGGGTNGVMTDVWEYLPQGQTTWSRVPWVWKTRFYSDIRLIGPNLAAPAPRARPHSTDSRLC
jgi:hypothetical protein